MQSQDDSDATNSVISVCDITIRYFGCAVMVSNVEKLIAASVKATQNKGCEFWKVENWVKAALHFVQKQNFQQNKKSKPRRKMYCIIQLKYDGEEF